MNSISPLLSIPLLNTITMHCNGCLWWWWSGLFLQAHINGDFSLSLESSDIRPVPAQIQVKRKNKSHSQRRRDLRQLLEKEVCTQNLSHCFFDLEIFPLITQGLPVSALWGGPAATSTNTRQTTQHCKIAWMWMWAPQKTVALSWKEWERC